jgi:Amt family ammonium transporter
MLGYSLAFGSGVWFIGGGEKFWFMGDSVTGKALTPVDGVYPLVGTVPEPVFCMFQLTFAIITR